MSTTLEYLPILSRGAHRSSSEGACLMEYVSHLAGETFSDQPPCTDPTLTAVARRVNDHTSDSARAQLALLAPDLAAIRRIDPNRVPVVAAYCARAALQLDPDNRWLRRIVHRAEARTRWLHPGQERGGLHTALSNRIGGMRTLIPLVVRRLIRSAAPDRVPQVSPELDRRLFQLLDGCLEAAGRDRRPGGRAVAVGPGEDADPIS